MLLNNEPLDLIDRELDVALRIGDLPDSNLIARRLSLLRTQVYASPAYIERHGEPLHPDDLLHHRTLGMQKMRRNGQYFWPLGDGESMNEYRIDPIMVANDPAGVRGALLCGEGLMLASDIMVKAYAEQGFVRRVLAGWTGPEVELNALFPRGPVTSPKIRAFVDFLVDRFSLDADYMQVLCPDARGTCAQAHGMPAMSATVAMPSEVAVPSDGAALRAPLGETAHLRDQVGLALEADPR
jgi:DNA-binding transcriptional LysR family regulator